jgi:8-amino-7-oxononanoate synthase
MDGNVADIRGLLALCERYDALLLLDDAHGFGVLGPQGRGSLAEAGLTGANASPRVLYMATLGKAAGVAGKRRAATSSPPPRRPCWPARCRPAWP